MTRILHRLKRMSAAELLSRGLERTRLTGEAVQFATAAGWHRRDLVSRLSRDTAELSAASRAICRADWPLANAALREHFIRRPSRFPIEPASRVAFAATIRQDFPSHSALAVQRASRVIQGRYDLLGYRGLSFEPTPGDERDWHFDPVHRRHAPARFWARVPYLDPDCGDHKIIWELNRHQHWLVLGRAAWLTGNDGYAVAISDELRSWLRANPPLTGINWASMLELGFRAISWIWALHFLAAFDPEPTAAAFVDLLMGLDRQLAHVARHLSYYFSPNTHLLGEGLALYVAGRVLPELVASRRWEQAGREILIRAAHAQVHADGGHAELSTHYHRYALDFYLLALVVARKTGDAAWEHFARVAVRLATFCRALADDDGRLPTIGDDDGGMLFPICGRPPADASDSLSLAAALLGQPELAVRPPSEEVYWMLGSRPDGRTAAASATPVRSAAFPSSGYIVLRGEDGHAIVDTGRHGFLNGGHAHADALSLVLSVHGTPLLIDPGTAAYTVDPRTRDRFRSTAMHNTVVVGGVDQSIAGSAFQWQTSASARCHVLALGNRCEYVEASHDGYEPTVHTRALLHLTGAGWLVIDTITGDGATTADAHWHLDQAWTAEQRCRSVVALANGQSRAALASTAPLDILGPGDQSGLADVAPVYGRIERSSTLRARVQGQLPLIVLTCILPGEQGTYGTASARPADGPDGWHAWSATIALGRLRMTVLRTIERGGRPESSVAAPDTLWGTHGIQTDARLAVLLRHDSGHAEVILINGRRFHSDDGLTVELPTRAVNHRTSLLWRAPCMVGPIGD